VTFEDVLLREAGSADLKAAAAMLARNLRREVDPQETLLNDSDFRGLPLTYDDIAKMGELRGIVKYEFGVPIAGEAELRPRADGGLEARTIHISRSGRALFAIAHEIGHTYFYDTRQTPAVRTISRLDDDGLPRYDRREEEFCDRFAWDLLVPAGSESTALSECATARTPTELVRGLEHARRWGLSISLALQRLNDFGWFPRELLAVVLRYQSHRRSAGEPALRVSAVYPIPATRWFVPLDQRAASIGFDGALRLLDWWHSFPNRDPSVRYRRSGKFGFSSLGGELEVVQNEAIDDTPCYDTLAIWAKRGEDIPWTRVSAPARVTYRLYAVSASDAYCLCVIDTSSLPV
jgi:hypothetical protein